MPSSDLITATIEELVEEADGFLTVAETPSALIEDRARVPVGVERVFFRCAPKNEAGNHEDGGSLQRTSRSGAAAGGQDDAPCTSQDSRPNQVFVTALLLVGEGVVARDLRHVSALLRNRCEAEHELAVHRIGLVVDGLIGRVELDYRGARMKANDVSPGISGVQPLTKVRSYCFELLLWVEILRVDDRQERVRKR